ncbi:class I SAM-dependent methyltransferase [Variovorax sp. J31P207]|uniref:class I SAM-dependent methyltransferase n=1 Tax=Variovorax sp. J31P207 TaxID=3053510 RepID=UPI002577B888|nr:class I SAM-dependent methyltransferase [Variovorax sp. J31P207]MDM0067119.1 methyltransferase domain-containing protein [Variovorax sp. J31P207]
MTASFRDFEHAGWTDPAVCASYEDLMAGLTAQSIEALLDGAGVAPGQSVLDVATGAGHAAAAAQARGAEVTGVDFSAEQVRLARRRYPAVRFEEGDAGRLPFEDRRFDAVMANYGVLHFPEPERFFGEAFRVLKPGGRLAFTVWDLPQKTRLFGAVLDAIRLHGALDVGLPAGPGMFMFADPSVSRPVLAAAGFVACFVTPVPQTFRAASGEAILRTLKTATVRTRGTLQRQQDGKADAIDASILKALEPYRNAEGYAVPMPAILTVATRP